MVWWKDRSVLADVVSDIMQAELCRLRPLEPVHPKPWPGTLPIGERGLACSEVEREGLAAALVRALRLDMGGLDGQLQAHRLFGSWVDLAQICLAFRHDSLVFCSSGSTALPKACTHRLVSLDHEAALLAGLFPGRRRIVSAVSASHLYGFLFSVLLPLALKVPVLRRLDQRDAPAVGLEPGDLVVGFPDFWRRAAASSMRFPPDVVGVTSKLRFPAELGLPLARLGLTRVIDIYGSTETGGIGYRGIFDTGFALLPHWSRAAKADLLIRVGPDGVSEPHRLQDRLRWAPNGRFDLAGRRDQLLRIDGLVVNPDGVTATLLRHPAVAAASVRRMRPEEGDRIKAFIVPKEGGADLARLEKDLSSWVGRHLPPAERPYCFHFGRQLPQDETGKAADWTVWC